MLRDWVFGLKGFPDFGLNIACPASAACSPVPTLILLCLMAGAGRVTICGFGVMFVRFE